MKRFKIFSLTLILTIGFVFQNCEVCPPSEGDYFDIQGFEIVNYTTTDGEVIKENQIVEYSSYESLTLSFDVEYLASNFNRENSVRFSLMNTAFAEECPFSGYKGSKEESISSLTVVTLNDFNDEYMANDTINEIINVRGTAFNLNEYLEEDSSLILYEKFELDLSVPPSLNEEFKVKIFLELSTDESYEAESIPFIIR